MAEHSQSSAPLRATLHSFAGRFTAAALYFLIVFVVGTIGYALIEGWGFMDGLYMAVTTVTSVGFQEVRALGPAGRLFTMVLIVLGVTGLGIWWALMTALIVELDLVGHLRRRRMNREISGLTGHFIVCGLGRMGRVVLDELRRSGTPLLVIEKDAVRAQRETQRHPDLLFIEGDATREQVLEQARIGAARGLAACLTSDADNILLSLTARGMRKDLTIVARAYDEENLLKLHKAGADHAISPNVTGGIRMASTLIRPSVVSFLDVTTTGAEIDLRMEEARIVEGSTLAGASLAEAQIPQRTGLIVLALQRPREAPRYLYNPGPETRLEPGDVMLVLGRPEQVAELRRYVSASAG